MLPSLLLAATLSATAGPVPPDAPAAVAGPAPRVMLLRADADGHVRVAGQITQTVTHTTIVRTFVNGQPVTEPKTVELEQVVEVSTVLGDLPARFTTAGGGELSGEAAAARLKAGGVVLLSADGKPVDPGWLRAFDRETVVVTSDLLKNFRPATTGRPTPTPRLALLAADPDGKVRLDTPAVPGGGRRAAEELSFEAFDLGGKLVPKADAAKRVAAGGLVLISADGHLPDAAFRRALTGDVLVLASAALAEPQVVEMRQPPQPMPAQFGGRVQFQGQMQLQIARPLPPPVEKKR